jgi:hypothetical protein
MLLVIAAGLSVINVDPYLWIIINNGLIGYIINYLIPSNCYNLLLRLSLY